MQNNISLKEWETVFQNIYNKQKLLINDSLNLKSLLESYSKDVAFREISEAELQFALKGMKNKKAPGLDAITNESLKVIVRKLSPQLTKFFNICMKKGSIPKTWKNANLKLLFKGSGSSSDTNNYRGINLSCSLYNLLDRIMKNRVYSTLSEEIPQNQYGFMRNKSTMHAIKILLNDVQHKVYTNNTQRYALFLDVKKAFDTINRHFIFGKLISAKKLAHEELSLLAEMLDINYLLVNDGVSQSAPIIQSNGVRQGASLSPFLFIYALSDINEIFKDCPGVKIILYADDVVLLSDDLNMLKMAADKLTAYLRDRELELNAEKCKIVKFKNGGVGRPKNSDVMYIGSEKIQFVNEFKYLGVTFQQSGKSFSKHVKKRVNAALCAIYRIKKLSQMSIQAGLKLFDLAIAPIISYGIEAIWPFLSTNDLNILETVKPRFLKRLLSLSKFVKSRFTYQLAECDLFIQDLRNKFKLAATANYENFLTQHLTNSSTIENKFYETPAMTDNKWKRCNFLNRHVYTRHACHGFHFKLCKNKVFHDKAEDDCVCEKCNEKMETYHFLECKMNNDSLHKVAKATNED
jgi:hypothetical protein